MESDGLTPAELVYRLSTAGRYPDPDLVDAILARRAETEPLLLDVFNQALHDEWPTAEDPRWLRFAHAGRFMIAWQTQDALPTFARLYGADEEAILNSCEWFEEDLVYFGPSVIPYLLPIIGKAWFGKWHYGKGLSGSILTRIATYYPETRAEIMAAFRTQLPSPEAISQEEDTMWGNWAFELGILADTSSRDQILALDDARALDSEFFNRKQYLHLVDHGFQPQPPPGTFDISAMYRSRYQHDKEAHQREAEQQLRERQKRRQVDKPSNTGKTGRNDPCPCGSGLKYKRCHGRPGVG